MIINCPECNTRYNLTAAQIGPNGRTLKCASCQHNWFQPPVKEEAIPPIPKAPPLPPENLVEKYHPKTVLYQLPPTMLASLGIGSILLLLMMIGMVWMFLRDHSSPVPESYSPVTFTGNAEHSEVHKITGLILSEIERDVLEDGTVTILMFKGKVTNTNAVPTPIPEIRVQLLDRRGIELDFWPANVKKSMLEPEESCEWSVRFLNPPLEQIAKYKAFFRTP